MQIQHHLEHLKRNILLAFVSEKHGKSKWNVVNFTSMNFIWLFSNENANVLRVFAVCI